MALSHNRSQIDLFSNVEQYLPERDKEMLNDPSAWHHVFLDQVINRISEERFADLCDEENDRRLLIDLLVRPLLGVTFALSR